MATDWNGIDLEESLNLFVSSLMEKAGIVINEGTELDEGLTQDYAELLIKLEEHLDFAVRTSNTLN